jgi:hypothetical protein
MSSWHNRLRRRRNKQPQLPPVVHPVCPVCGGVPRSTLYVEVVEREVVRVVCLDCGSVYNRRARRSY